MSLARVLVVAAVWALALSACKSRTLGPEAERGRQLYTSQCTVCHAFDPSQPGAVGPDIRGSSRELLDAKVLHARYPPGYRPKRPTAVMPPQTQLGPADIDALAAFLK